MALWPVRASRVLTAVSAAPVTHAERADVQTRDLSTAILEQMDRSTSGKANRAHALQVPALAKALQTYCQTIATFPLTERVDGQRTDPRPLLEQPVDGATYQATMARLVTDLLLEDVAWWRIRERSWDGWPVHVSWMPAEKTTVDDTGVRHNGTLVPARDVIRFDGAGLGGWLVTGAQAITTAAALEAASYRYAETPVPTLILKNTGADLPPTGPGSVDELLAAWEAARLTRSTAYLNSVVSVEGLGFNADELQLTDSRNASAVQIARIANLDPVWVGAGVPGTSLTYANRTDLYRQLVDLSLGPVMASIAGRLSLPDVTPRGHTVVFDTDAFLRANTLEIGTLVAQQIPLGVITVPEARDLLDLPAEA